MKNKTKKLINIHKKIEKDLINNGFSKIEASASAYSIIISDIMTERLMGGK